MGVLLASAWPSCDPCGHLGSSVLFHVVHERGGQGTLLEALVSSTMEFFTVDPPALPPVSHVKVSHQRLLIDWHGMHPGALEKEGRVTEREVGICHGPVLFPSYPQNPGFGQPAARSKGL